MSSIGIFYSTKAEGTPNTGAPVKANAYINFFKFRIRGWKYERFCDIGVLVKDVTDHLESISFYLPFKVEKNSIIDLGKDLFDGEMLSTLFDHDYQVNNVPSSPSYAYATSSDSSHPGFWIYQLKGNNFTIKELNHGTLIRVSIDSRPKGGFIQQKEAAKSCNLYLRFRIENINENSFGSVESISNDWLQSAFSKVEMLSLQFNKTRFIDKSDFEELSKQNNYLGFGECHLFFIGSAENETVHGSQPCIKRQSLESDLWKKYMKNHNPLGNKCLSYEWECDNEESPEFLVTTIYSKLDVGKLIKYCSVILIFGIMSSLIAGFVYHRAQARDKRIESMFSEIKHILENNDGPEESIKPREFFIEKAQDGIDSNLETK